MSGTSPDLWNIVSPNCPHPGLQKLRDAALCGKGDFANVIKSLDEMIQVGPSNHVGPSNWKTFFWL